METLVPSDCPPPLGSQPWLLVISVLALSSQTFLAACLRADGCAAERLGLRLTFAKYRRTHRGSSIRAKDQSKKDEEKGLVNVLPPLLLKLGFCVFVI